MNDHAIKVLIVDDSEVDRYMYRRYLELASPRYQVHEAANRHSGVHLAKTVNPDCVLLDLRFPNDYGIEILQDLVSDDQPRRVIVLSVLSNEVLQEGALSIGARKYLVKSQTTAPLLHQAIQEVIGNA